MTKLVFDSSAWIDYFLGTEKGRRIRALITADATIFTTGAIAAEVLVRIERAGASVEDAKGAMMTLGALAPFDLDLARDTATLYVKQRKSREKFSLVDAHVLAISQQYKAKIITCDNDFAGLPNTFVVR